MEPFLDTAPLPMLVENDEQVVLWSNKEARNLLGSLSEGWRNEHLHYRTEGELYIVEGHTYAITRQEIPYQGNPATLFWFVPRVSSIEQERDPLTALPSFGSFLRTLERQWTDAIFHDFAIGLVTIDIARFSVLNEVLGAKACDEILCQVAKRFSKLIEVDSRFSRVNGDQFVISLVGSVKVGEFHPHSIYAKGEALIHRIVNELERPFRALDRPVNLKVSVGLSTSELCETPAELMTASHRALLSAKKSRESEYAIFNREMLKEQERQKTLALELEVALREGQLKLLYQPYVELKTGKLTGTEALIRWDHPVHGQLQPEHFLGAAEVSNMMFPIGRWVVKEVIKTATEHPDLLYSLNLSAQQMLDPDFLPTLSSALEEHGVKPETIVIEILESSSSTTLDSVRLVLNCISESGVGLALDDADFDSRALAMLNPLSLRYVKVDRKVVRDLHLDETRSFCKAILALASSLKRMSLAVGVESLEQCRFLRQSGCDWGQGHFFSPAGPASEIALWKERPFLV